MNFSNKSSSFNPAFFDLFSGSLDLTEQKFQFHGGRQQPAYRGMSVQRLDAPFPVYHNQSTIHKYNADFSGLLKEYVIAPLASTNPAGSSGIDMSEIPPPALQKYVPWDSGNQPVNGALSSIPNICPTQQLFQVKSEPEIREPTPAPHSNSDYWLTHPPVVFFNPQDSGSVAVVHTQNLNQAASNNQTTQAEEITDGNSSIIEHQRVLRKDPIYAKRKGRYPKRSHYQANPVYAEHQRKRQKERYHNDPDYAERVKKRQREYIRELRKDPAYRERERKSSREYQMKRKKIESPAKILFTQSIKGNTTS